MTYLLCSPSEIRAYKGGARVFYRAVKPQPPKECIHSAENNGEFLFGVGNLELDFPAWIHKAKSPFRPGEVLHLRESFWCVDSPYYGDIPCLVYEDEFLEYKKGIDIFREGARPCGIKFGHHSSVHMPPWAVRFRPVIDTVTVEQKDGAWKWAIKVFEGK